MDGLVGIAYLAISQTQIIDGQRIVRLHPHDLLESLDRIGEIVLAVVV